MDTRQKINKVPLLERKLCALKEDVFNLEFVNTISDFRLKDTVLEIEYINNNNETVILQQDIFTLQETEIKDNVRTYDDLLSILNPELYQFAYVRESQGSRWLPGSLGGNYYGSGLYMWDGTQWIEDDKNIFNQLEQIINNLNLEIQERIDNDNLLDNKITILENEKQSKLSEGFFVDGDKTKLDAASNHAITIGNPHSTTATEIGAETSSQLDARDTANRDRQNHSGTQEISTVTGLQTQLDLLDDHIQITSGNPHNVTKTDVGLYNVDNTSDEEKNLKNWFFLVSNWDTSPSIVKELPTGAVYVHTYKGVNRYRFAGNDANYTSQSDAFYEDFDSLNDTLIGKIVSRAG